MEPSEQRRVYQRPRPLALSARRVPWSEQQDAFPDAVLPASPLRVGSSFGLHPEDTPTQSGSLPRRSPAARVPPSTGVRRAVAHSSVPLDPGLLEDADLGDMEGVLWRSRTSVVVRRAPGQSAGTTASATALSPIPPRARALVPLSAPHETADPLPSSPSRRSAPHVHWLVWIGGGMLLTRLVPWWQVLQDDWRYGRPRTFQIDARVGHEDALAPSHFIALNLDRHLLIIELPGGDPTKARVYRGPILLGNGEELTPVTLSFADVNHDGKLDLLVHIQDQVIVWLNDGSQFRPPGQTVTRSFVV